MVPLKVLTLVVAGQNQPSVLVLQPVEETPARKARVVPIWIGPTEAAQIGMALEHVKFARPMTHDLMLDGAHQFGCARRFHGDLRIEGADVLRAPGSFPGRTTHHLRRPGRATPLPWRFGKMRRSILKRRYLTLLRSRFSSRVRSRRKRNWRRSRHSSTIYPPRISEISNSFSFLSSVII